MNWAGDKALVFLLVAVVLLTSIPAVEIFTVIGHNWRGLLPTFVDELNFARVHTIGEGHLMDGNAYYLEHAGGPPLVVFGGAWLNAVPFWLGLSYIPALYFNFILWSVLFALSAYWLLRELKVSPWFSALGTLLLYLESYAHVWRPANLQPVYPFFFLLYVFVLKLIREQSRRNIILLGLVTGASFYLFAYLWQIAVTALGLLFLYALVRRQWPLLKATLFASLIGGVIGLPVPLYTLWLSHTSPYFWESMGRLGLVHTHLPTSEIFYSGGWIGIILAFLSLLYWRARPPRQDSDFSELALFLALTGMGLWIMQASNLVTGIWLETGEHVREFIVPWLMVATISIGAFLWRRRGNLSARLSTFSLAVMALLVATNGYFVWYYFVPFLTIGTSNPESWLTLEQYAGPLQWLNAHEPQPVVVWSDPHDELAQVLPVFTNDFLLDSGWGMFELVSDQEIQERYLVSQYFNNPTTADLASQNDIGLYLGRQYLFHVPKTIEREVKVCKILFFWDKQKNCGTVPTTQSLLGEQFFGGLEQKFQTDIKPNIKEYLAKYHVSYILKDKELNPAYRPEELGAVLVYSDDRFELYKLR